MRTLICLLLILNVFLIVQGQTITYSRVIDYFPLNGEIGSEIYETEDGYIIIVEHDCVAHSSTSNICTSIIKINEVGETIWMTELNMDVSWVGHFLEMPEAFYITGTNANTSNPMALAKINKQGELIWQKELDFVPLSSGGLGIIENESGHILIIGARRRPWISQTIGWEPYIITVTKEGELLDLFYFNSDYNNTFPYRIILDPDGRYIISYIYCNVCGLNRPGGVIALDSHGNTLMRNEFPEKFAPLSCFVEQWSEDVFAYNWYHWTNPPDITQVLDPPAIFFMDKEGDLIDSLIFFNQAYKDILFTETKWGEGMVGTGSQVLNYTNPQPNLQALWLFKIDQERHLSWERAYADTTDGGFTYSMYQIRHTKDGGVIAIGGLSNTMTGVFETHVWLLKLDSMGCLTPGCDEVNIITATEPVVFPSGLALQLYPNPATSEVTLSLPQELPDHDLLTSLVSPSGQVLRQQSYLHPSIRFDTTGLPPGMYYVTVHRKGSLVGVEKLMIAR